MTPTAANQLPTPSALPWRGAMSLKVYINGKLYDKEDAKISVYDHGLLYGDGVFEGMRSYGGKVFRLDEHLERLWNSAKAIWLEIPMSHKEMADAIYETLQANGSTTATSAWSSPAEPARLGLDPNRMQRPAGDHHHRPHHALSRRAVREGAGDRHGQHDAQSSGRLSPRIKSLNYLNNILAKIEGLAGRLRRSADAQPQGRSGRVHRRQHLPRPRRRAAHAADRRRHSGRHHARRRDRAGPRARPSKSAKSPSRKHDVYIADECFLTGTAAEVIPVVKVDSRTIGNGKPGPITLRPDQSGSTS